MEKLKVFFSNKLNLILVVILVLLLGGGVFAGMQFFNRPAKEVVLEEEELTFREDGPYALLEPRRDGNAINLNFKRISSYDAFSYEIVYESEGVDRGAGSLDTFIELKDERSSSANKKSDYTQEILFGTCSKGDTFSTLHCVFDKNVENGTLTLHIKDNQNKKLLKMITKWHFQKPDVSLGLITSADEHFKYKTEAGREELSRVGFTLVNDLTAVPKLPNNKQVQGVVYAFNVPTARDFPAGEITMELADTPAASAKIARYVESKNEWELLETKIEGSKLAAKAGGAGIFAVLIDRSSQ